MNSIIFVLIFLLLFVFYQDVKYRQIHIFLPILIFSLSCIIQKKNTVFSIKLILLNCCFLILTLVLLTAYMSIKNKQILNPFRHYFGLGDFLFFISISPLFVTYNYILGFIFSMVFSIFLQLIFVKLMRIKTVPLAGFSALFLAFIIIKDLFLEYNKITIIR